MAAKQRKESVANARFLAAQLSIFGTRQEEPFVAFGVLPIEGLSGVEFTGRVYLYD